jgi:DNA-binding NtrC family response regulator
VNCGAIPEGTIDSELFGHVKGSFTNALDDRKGYFETVNGGTIFLDEVGELPLGTQARLLRVLESGEFIRVGSSKVQKTDVRVVAATNVDLHNLIQNNRFREDLFYRLNTVPILVPALRERKEDIYLLFRKFSSDFAEKYRTPLVQLEPAAIEMLSEYPWPGNIRELKNVAEQVSVLAGEQVVTADILRPFLPNVNRPGLPMLKSEFDQTQTSFTERELFYKVLYDMKRDLNDLKQFVLSMAEVNQLKTDTFVGGAVVETTLPGSFHPMEHTKDRQPVVIEPSKTYPLEQQIEENLSLADKEKELILKALKKHKGKRKDAALDLGISERTLYRKIREYELE